MRLKYCHYLLVLTYGCLALILNVIAYGKDVAQAIFTKDEIVKSLKRESMYSENLESLELIWGLTEESYNNQQLFIAVHAGRSHQVASIYLQVGEKFRLLKQIEVELSYFYKPNIFWYEFKKGDRLQLIHLTSVAEGTGHYNTEYIFRVVLLPLNDGVILEPVEFVPAPQSYASQLKKGEGVWKGEINIFGPEGFKFEFYIWKKGDSNCCPSAGFVTGEYELKKETIADGREVWKIEANSFKRHALKESY